MRTTVLVCTAASLAMLQMDLLSSMPDTHNSIVRLDLMRLPLGILSGMGFLGAGAIVRKGSLVRGVTTAASLWITTVLGLCFGGGQIALGAVGTAIAFATLWGLKRVEGALFKSHHGVVLLDVGPGGPDETTILRWLKEAGFVLRERRVERRSGTTAARMRFEGRYEGTYPAWSAHFVRSLMQREGIAGITWTDED
jgi:putative Mg2+ transporter-C (MgtC) family protein